jgi:hypothetical protein
MTDWSKLRDVSGSAEYIPELLEELKTSHDQEIIRELWDRLCHQGSVYSASFAALPELILIAEQWYPSEDCLQIIWLAIAILTGEDGDNIRHPHDPSKGEKPQIWMTTADRIDIDSPNRSRYQTEIDVLLRLTEAYLQQPNLLYGNFESILSSIVALKGYPRWGEALNHFSRSSYGWGGSCNRCKQWIDIYNDNDGLVVAEVEKDDASTLQTFIDPASPELLTGIARWLYETALNRGHNSVVQNIIDMLGTGNCPECNAEFKVPTIMEFKIS